MHTTGKQELVTEPTPVRGPHCTLEQARELLEGLRAAYQSLLPAEQIMIRSMIAQIGATAIRTGNEGTQRRSSSMLRHWRRFER
jgi:hypothetical protein